MNNTKTVWYREVRELRCRGAVDQAEPEDVEGTLLVGDIYAVTYTDEHSNYGYADKRLFPAFKDGKRAWLLKSVWCPAWGYSAEGIEDTILSFEEGVKILNEQGVFDFAPPAALMPSAEEQG